MSSLNPSLIARTLESHISNMWRMEEEYLRGKNPEAAKSVRDEIGRIREQIDVLKSLSLKSSESPVV